MFCNDGWVAQAKILAVLCQTAGWRVTDLRLALRPGAVSPAVAGPHQAGLPLLHLGRTRSAVTLGSLDHCPPPPQFACTKADIGKEKLFIHEDSDRNAEIWPVRGLGADGVKETSRSEQLEECGGVKSAYLNNCQGDLTGLFLKK